MNGEIFISPNNKMAATYRMHAVEESDVLVEIDIRTPEDSDINAEISIRAEEESKRNVGLEVKYRGNSDVYVEIQPVGHDNIDAEIEIRSGNRMWALYEVQEPPKLLDVRNPVKDSFTRENPEYQSINYGGNSSLAVGKTADDSYVSYIQFDFSEWNSSYVIIDSKLRLHYSGVIPQNAKLTLSTLSESWSEYGITYLNKPSPVDLMVDEHVNYPNESYIEFEFTDVVVRWIRQIVENRGLQINLINEKDMYLNFRARESNRPPELLTTYYDARVYSAGRSQTLAEIFVWQVGGSEILAEIEVDSVLSNGDMPVEIYAHRYEVPVDTEQDVEITVTKPNIHVEMTVAISDDNEIPVEISSRVEKYSELREIEVTVSKPDVHVEIYVAHTDEKDVEITVQRNPDDDIDAEIIVTRPEVSVEVFVAHTDSIDVEISVQDYIDDGKDVGVTVSRPSINVEIIPRAVEYNSVGVEIEATRVYLEEKDVEIVVSRQSVDVEIAVSETSEFDVEIHVKHRDDIDVEIDITVFDDILVEIDVLPNNNADSEIAVSKPDIHVEIIVPYWDDSDRLVEIQPRILQVSDRDVIVTIRGKNTGYAFII